MARRVPDPTYRQANTAPGPGGRVIATQHGDVYYWHFDGTKAPYLVERFRGEPAKMPATLGLTMPSRLLGAAYEVVPFFGRQTERRQLRLWLDDAAEPSLSVRLVHGRGGQGKSRLATEVAKDAVAEGWAVVAARHHTHVKIASAQHPGEVSVTSPRGLLLLVDYADRWPVADLAQLVSNNLALQRPLRLLLLARSPAGWWAAIRSRLQDAGLFGVDELALDPLALDPAQRLVVFGQATTAFADKLAVPSQGEVLPPASLESDPSFSHALTIHMAALVAVLRVTEHEPSAGAIGPESLISFLLDREKQAWGEAYRAGEVSTLPLDIQRAAFVAILTRAQPYPAAAAVLAATGVAHNTEEIGHILADHALFYVPSHPDTRLEPLYPDKLAEGFLALCTTAVPGADLHDPWARGAISSLLTSEDCRTAAPYTRDAMTVLVETARNWPIFAERTLKPLLKRHPDLAVRAGGAALSRLMPILRADLELAKLVNRALPKRADVDLDDAAADITELATRSALSSADPARRAAAHAHRGFRHAKAARREEALAATEEAVALYRELARRRSEAFTPDLALSLNNLGNRFAAVGRLEEALAVTEEAVALYRELARGRPEAFTPDVAMALHSLGNRFGAVGRREDALAATEEAVTLRRELALRGLEAFTPDLAASLNNYGLHLAALGRLEEALAVTEETVSLRRELARQRPDAFTPDLAGSLNNLGMWFADLGRRGEALVVTEEAVALYRELARRRPEAFTPDLARSLNNLGNRFADVGRREEALAVSEEAVTLRRELTRQRPEAFTPDLARSLNNLGNLFAALGRREEALAVSEEAVTLRRELARQQPEAFTPDLATTLNNLGNLFATVGRWEEALAASEEAVTLRRELARRRPEVFTPYLAKSLSNFGLRLVDQGRCGEALIVTEEAVALYRQLARRRPKAFTADLATALNILGRCSPRSIDPMTH